ncbi:MAG TPA: DUF4129 domain-containing protein [Pyrinomonadaceae bacterium]|nr:DUF4129 domain-containing protein [Pyrinomonadaceae bacterium]
MANATTQRLTRTGNRKIPHHQRRPVRVGLLMAMILVCVQTGFAITFPEYRQRVKTAIHSLQSINPDQKQQLSTDDPKIPVNVQAAREALPRKETIEWQGHEFVAENGWLDDQLKDVERSDTTASARSISLQRILERLEALDERLEEVDRYQGPLANKSDARDRLSTILQRSEYARAVKEETAISRILRWIEKLVARLFPKRNPLSPSKVTTISRFAQIFVIVIAVAALGYAIWTFAPKLLNRRKAKKPAKDTARVVLGERLEPDQTAADLLAEAERLARAGDLRGAIRKGYIALLVELADRKLISLAQYKTNRDYLRSIRSLTELHRNMESLTNKFEVHWYGFVPPNETDWAAFRAGYKEAVTSN